MYVSTITNKIVLKFIFEWDCFVCATTNFVSLKQYFYLNFFYPISEERQLVFCFHPSTVASYPLKNNVLLEHYFWIRYVSCLWCSFIGFKSVLKKRNNSFAKGFCLLLSIRWAACVFWDSGHAVNVGKVPICCAHIFTVVCLVWDPTHRKAVKV